MKRIEIFTDESGDFAFNRNVNASKYFILCAALFEESSKLANELIDLKRELAWKGLPLGDYFHATNDKQVIRDHVFDLLSKHKFQIFCQVMEKSKAQDHVKRTEHDFYKYGWFYLLRFGIPQINNAEEAHFITASLGTRRDRAAFSRSVEGVVSQFGAHRRWVASFWPASTDPCLQAIDYCCWAIQRKWEREDARSYDRIKDKIRYEYDLWQNGNKYNY